MQWAGESARQHIPCVLFPKPLSCSSRQLTALMGPVAISCRPFLCVLCLQNRAQKHGIRRSGGFCTVQPLNHTSVSTCWVQYVLPKTAAPSYLVLSLPLKIKSSHPCTDPIVGSHAGVVTLDHSVILIVQNGHRTTCCILRRISVPSGIFVGQKLL